MEHLGALGAYTVLTVPLTYPLAFRLSTRLPGDGKDLNIFVWNLWWTKKAITELHTSPFRTDYLFYPEGTSLVCHFLAPFQGALGIPLQALVGHVPVNHSRVRAYVEECLPVEKISEENGVVAFRVMGEAE